MAMQRVFTFYSPVDQKKMIGIITNTITNFGGKVKVSGNIVTAKWSFQGITAFRHKFVFYVGKDIVRVTTNDSQKAYYKAIKWEYRLNKVMSIWDGFVIALRNSHANLDFGLEHGKFYMVSAKIMSDGIEQTFSSTSVTNPSIGGALIGGALFGGVGAIVGGSRSKTRTSGTTKAKFSNKVLVKARYSNGLNIDGEVSKKSETYNRIMAGLCEVTEK